MPPPVLLEVDRFGFRIIGGGGGGKEIRVH